MRTPRPILAGCLVAALIPAAAAEAKAPPTGKYACTIGGSTLFGTLTIKASGKYAHRGSKGRFKAAGGRVTFRDGISGWKIGFRKGTLHNIKGRWYKATTGRPGARTRSRCATRATISRASTARSASSRSGLATRRP